MIEAKLSYNNVMDLLRMPVSNRKDYIQTKLVDYIAKYRHVLLEAYTGFGKTTTVVKLCRRFREKFNHPIVVVVPTNTLKEQWRKDLAEFDNVHIYVVNQYTMNHDDSVVRVCGVFVADEGHTMLNSTNQYFHKALKFAKASFTCVLSATISNEHKAFLMKCGIENVFKLPLEMGKKLDLLPPYNHVNFSVPLTKSESIAYINTDKAYRHFAKLVANINVTSPYDQVLTKREQYCASELGTNVKEFRQWRFRYGDAFRTRKSIIELSENKKKVSMRILSAFRGEKALVYAENTQFLDYLVKHDSRVCGYYKDVLASPVKRRNALAAFGAKILPYMASCKAVKLGFNDEEVYLGLRTSYSAKESDLIQQIGRITRLDQLRPSKSALFINLVTPHLYNGDELLLDSYEFSSLSYQQRDLKDIQWLTDEDELLELIEDTINRNL